MTFFRLSLKEWLEVSSGVLNLRDRLLFLVLYSTGCSESELISLRFSDINAKKSVIRFTNRDSVVPKKVIMLLLSFQKELNALKTDFIFSSRQSKQLTTKRVQQIIISTSKQILGKSITPQDIRYTHIYHALLKQVSIISIAKQTGLSYQRLAQIIEQIAAQEKLDFRYEL